MHEGDHRVTNLDESFELEIELLPRFPDLAHVVDHCFRPAKDLSLVETAPSAEPDHVWIENGRQACIVLSGDVEEGPNDGQRLRGCLGCSDDFFAAASASSRVANVSHRRFDRYAAAP